MNKTALLTKKISASQFCGIGDEAGFTLDEQIHIHQQLNWRNMELRTIAGIHIAKMPKMQFSELKSKLEQAAIHVPVLASKIGDWSSTINDPFEKDIDELNALIELAHLLKTPYIRIMSYPNDDLDEMMWGRLVIKRVKELAKRAANNNIILLHENCHGWAALDPGRALQLIEETENKGFAFLFDIGNPVVHGYDGIQYLKQIIQYVHHVHVKDANALDDVNECFTLPGQGQARIKEAIQLLLENNYNGCISIEPHLSLIPHNNKIAKSAELAESYVNYGQQLIQLLSEFLNKDERQYAYQ